MYEIDLKIGGMMCGMCESHINDAVRKALPVKKVTSSHSKGQTVILSPGPYAQLYGGDVIVLVGSPAAAEAAHRLVTEKEVP